MAVVLGGEPFVQQHVERGDAEATLRGGERDCRPASTRKLSGKGLGSSQGNEGLRVCLRQDLDCCSGGTGGLLLGWRRHWRSSSGRPAGHRHSCGCFGAARCQQLPVDPLVLRLSPALLLLLLPLSPDLPQPERGSRRCGDEALTSAAAAAVRRCVCWRRHPDERPERRVVGLAEERRLLGHGAAAGEGVMGGQAGASRGSRPSWSTQWI